jgi:hypothetical protein
VPLAIGTSEKRLYIRSFPYYSIGVHSHRRSAWQNAYQVPNHRAAQIGQRDGVRLRGRKIIRGRVPHEQAFCFANSLARCPNREKFLVLYARGSWLRRIMEEQTTGMRIIGIVLICIGLLTLALPYVTFTKQEKIIDIGPVEAVAETKERIPVSPIIGAVVLIAGAGIVIASMKKGSP